MGAIAGVAVAIGSAIASAAAAVISVVSVVISAVTSAVAAIGSAIYGAVSAVVSSVAGAISAVAAKVWAGMSYVISSISTTVVEIGAKIGYYAQMLYGKIQYFARVIHLKTILKVHKIAYIVSEDYRQMMNKVYNKFAEVSYQLKLPTQFLNLAIRNAKSVVLDASAMMGKSYDLAEITWLKSFTSFTKKFERKVMRYHMEPGEVFNDIDKYLLRDSINAASKVQQTVFVTIQKTAEIVNETVQDVVTLRDDIDKFVSDLPQEIREEIKPYIDPITEKVDGFLEDEYWPYKQKVDAIIDVLNNKQDTVKNRVDGIVGRLTRPGDLLRDVDSLPIEQRIAQENKISEVAARADERQADNLQVQAQPTWEHLEKLRQALEEAPPPPEYIVRERKRPIAPAGQQSRKADTWFVGDY